MTAPAGCDRHFTGRLSTLRESNAAERRASRSKHVCLCSVAKLFSKLIRKYIYEPLLNSNRAIPKFLDEKRPVLYFKVGRRYKIGRFLDQQIGMPAIKAPIWQVVGIDEGPKTKQQLEMRFLESFPEARPTKPGAIADLFG